MMRRRQIYCACAIVVNYWCSAVVRLTTLLLNLLYCYALRVPTRLWDVNNASSRMRALDESSSDISC